MRELLMAVAVLAWPALLLSGPEFQYWNNFGIEYRFSNRVEFQLSITHKFTDAARELGQYNYTPGIGFILSPNFDVAVHYKFQDKKETNVWQREHRFDCVPKIHWDKNTVRYQVQSKIEYRHLESERFWRFREKISVEKHLIISDIIIDPFISAEIFYRMAAREVTQVRMHLGISTPLCRAVKFELYYVRNSGKTGSNWRAYNALGTKFALDF
ncbi:MAG TPA: DUF2490 domain-containing protein [bacterium]|nr:DUF2490 domain-containing protein [bacterium]